MSRRGFQQPANFSQRGSQQSALNHHAALQPSGRSSSDNSDATENASVLLGGNVNATIDTAEYKDTVLFLAQQQRLQHQEMMDVMKSVLLALHDQHLMAASSRGGATDQGTAAAPVQGGSFASASGDDHLSSSRRGATQPQATSMTGISNLEHNVAKLRSVAGAPGTNPRQLSDGSVGLSGSYAGTQANWFRSMNSQETELVAAKSRIAQLEAHVHLLEAQLCSKDETIRALTEANIASIATLTKSSVGAERESIFASPSAARGSTGAAAVSSSSRLANLHQSAAEELNEQIVGALAARPAACKVIVSSLTDGGTSSQAAADTPGRDQAAAAAGSSKLSSPALRQLLERHQQRCQQLLA
jgi:hypothetical protein